ncbi:MAG: VCBS domain-containing protein [Legionella sp.]|nr:VCBS domain-containing protein [Legionella sp.]
MKEDTAVSGGNLLASGALTISDVDTGEAAFVAQSSVSGNYGSFSVNAAGEWTYAADNSQSAIQALPEGSSLTDTFSVASIDGASQQITITINGTNDAAVIGGVATSTIKEDTAVSGGNLLASGALTISDVDTGEAAFVAQSGVSGNYGSFSVNAAGEWTYAADNSQSAIQALPEGSSLTDTFSVASIDGASQQITITINGTNDAAVIGGVATSTIKEDTAVSGGNLLASGTLTISDVDTGEAAFVAQNSVSGNYGSFSVNAAGEWTYSADNSQSAVQSLPAGGSLTDTFTVASVDGGTTQLITLTINGTNDLAVIGGVATATLTEDTNVTGMSAMSAGSLNSSGVLTIIDVDAGEAAFIAQSNVAGNYGSFSVNAVGEWTYTADNGQSAIQSLPAGGSITDTFTVASVDGGTTQLITITINGINDAAIIAGVSTGIVKEDTNVTGGNLLASGTLTITDVDTGQAAFVASSNVSGNYGSFSVNVAGDWTYSADNNQSAIQALPQGGSLTDTFTVASIDGTTKAVTITINGTNDSAVIGGVSTGSVKEDTNVSGVRLNASGILTISDVDTGQAAFITQNNVVGNYGTFSINTSGAWAYIANNNQSVIQALPEGNSLTDTFAVASVDGTTQLVTITINGTNDIAVIGGVSTSTVMEDTNVSGGNLLASGALTITDVDTGQAAFIARSNVDGNYGSFNVDSAGNWTYFANNSQLPIQGLPAGGSLTETFSVSSLDGSATRLVTITINGTNDVAVIGGVSTGVVQEDISVSGGNLLTSGTLTIADADTGQAAFVAQSNVAGNYGSFSITTGGAWSYSASNSQTAIQALPAGGSLTETFTVSSLDGSTTQLVTITINGTNDVAVIGGVSTGAVLEDTGVSGGNLLASGNLTITDVDTGQAAFVGQSNVAGNYGSFTITTGGAWSYSASNSQTAIQALPAGGSLTDTFTVASVDGTTKLITININGINDTATIGGVVIGIVTEDTNVSGGNLLASGTLTITDVDTGQAAFVVQNNISGNYGSFSVNAAGNWTYVASNSQTAIQALPQGNSLTDTFTVSSVDGTATKLITITINGTNDAAVIGGVSTGSVTEDTNLSGANLQTSGSLTISDVDTGQALFIGQSGAAGNYGIFSVTASGSWDYIASNSQSAIQSLPAGGSLTDSFTVTSVDGTTKLVTVTINGTNDAAVIGGTSTGTVTEDTNVSGGNLITSGTLTITDVDTGQAAFIGQSSVTGNYGIFSVSAAGNWTYIASNSQSVIQALPAGSSLTDTFTVASIDGTTKLITITINGTNDAAIIGGVTTATVKEDTAVSGGNLLASGSLTISDVDTGQASFVAQGIVGSYGALFNINTSGQWTYQVNNSNSLLQKLAEGTTVVDRFTVTSLDGTPQEISVTVTGTNDAPIAQAGLIKIGEGDTVKGQLIATDIDAGDASKLTYSVVSGPASGVLVLNSDGSYSYQPNTTYFGADSFTYRVTDSQGATSSAATVDISVFERRYEYTLDNETLANTGQTSGTQMDPDVASLSNGGYVIVWEGAGTGDTTAVWGQRYDSFGQAVGSNFRINVTTTNTQQNVAVKGTPSGGFVATWESAAQDGSGSGVYFRIYDANGVGGSEIRANQTTTQNQTAPDVVTLSNGNIYITWQSTQSGTADIYGRLFNSAGTALTNEVLMHTATGTQSVPTIATYGSSNNMIIAWQDNAGGTNDIKGQLVTSSGTLSGSNFTINNTITNSQTNPAVATLANGGFVVGWEWSVSANNDGVMARIYNSSGVAVGNEFNVNTTTAGTQTNIALTGLSNGGFLATWTSPGTGNEIFAQEFDASGNKIGAEFLVNVTITNAQEFSALATLADGTVVAAWESLSNTGSIGEDVYYSLLKNLNQGALIMAGGAGNDSFMGTSYADTFTGGTGDDRFEGRGGADSFTGGDGSDTVVYTSSTQAVQVNLTTGVGTGGDAQGDTYNTIENVVGSSFNDTLTGNTGDNILTGGAGNDTLSGVAGTNTFILGLGSDTVFGGTGLDTVSYQDSVTAVTVNLTTGTSSFGDTFNSVENIRGSALSDSLSGNASNNIIEGGAGADALFGGGGVDTLSYTNSNAGVTINLQLGTASGGHAQGDTYSNFQNVIGSQYNDVLVGDSNNNTFTPLGGNDVVMGGAGDDLFIFGEKSGNNTVYGGTDTTSGGSWIDAVQIAGATAGPAAHISTQTDWLLHTDAAYTVVANKLTFTDGNAAGTVTISDGSTVNFVDIDEIRWS